MFEVGEKVWNITRSARGEIVEVDSEEPVFLVLWENSTSPMWEWLDDVEPLIIAAPKPPAQDLVNHPAHYNTGKIEVIDFIEDQCLEYHEGNTVKYISRAGKKNPDTRIEDLEKGVWHLQRKIALLKGEIDG